MERSKRDTMLGLVFFAGIGLLMWATAQLSSFSFAEKQKLTVFFPTAAGLRDGDPIFVLGRQSGQVLEVRYQPNRLRQRIRVVMQLDDELTLRRDARIEIRDSTLLGGKQLDVDPGTAQELWGSAEIIGFAAGGAFDSFGEADFAGTVTAIRDFFQRLNDPDNNIGAFLHNRDVFDDLRATIASLRTSVEAIERGRAPLGKVIHDEDLGQDLSETMRELRSVVHKINEGTGLLARVLNDADLGEDIAAIFREVRLTMRELRDGEGILARLLRDGEMARDLEGTLDNLNTASRKLNDPDAGLLGALFGDTKLREDAELFVTSLSEVARKINEGKGTLARLINDEHMAERLDRILTQVSRAIEDAREAAPVGTFFQVLSGPF